MTNDQYFLSKNSIRFICGGLLGVLSLLTVACNTGEEDGGIRDTDTVLDAIVEFVDTDRRNIPLECTSATECDDRDECTTGECVAGECVYTPEFKPMEIVPVPLTKPALDAAIIGNRLYVAVGGPQPAVQIFNVAEREVVTDTDSSATGPANADTASDTDEVETFVEVTFRESVPLAAPPVGIDATWGAFAAVEGEAGMEVFATDSLPNPVATSAVDEGVLIQLDTVVDIAVSNSSVWIAGYNEGISLLTGDANALSYVGTVDTVGRVVAMAPRGNSALVADSLIGVVPIVLQDDAPVAGEAVATLGRVVDVDVNQRSAVSAEYGAGFSLIDISRMTEPERVLRVPTDSPVVAVRMLGSQSALIFTEAGEVMRVHFIDFLTPRMVEKIQLGVAPMARGVDFYRGIGAITRTDGTVTLLRNGCHYE